jgi:hypothetical protein
MATNTYADRVRGYDKSKPTSYDDADYSLDFRIFSMMSKYNRLPHDTMVAPAKSMKRTLSFLANIPTTIPIVRQR